MGYATTITAVFDALIAKIVACSSFGATKVSGDYIKSWEGISYPIATVRLIKDNMPRIQLGGTLVEHDPLQFSVTVKKDGTGTQDNVDSIVSLAGEIVDAIEANRQLSVSTFHVETYVSSVDYSLSQSKSAIFYYAVLIVTVKILRHV